MVIKPNEKIFDAGGDLLQIGDDYILNADGGREEVAEKHKSYFKDIARITVIRDKATGWVIAIEYKTKGQLSAFRIDGCGRAEMEEIASLLGSRTKGFPINWVEKRSDLFPFLFLAGYAAVLGLVVFIVWRYPDWNLGNWDYRVRLALGLFLLLLPVWIYVFRACFRQMQK